MLGKVMKEHHIVLVDLAAGILLLRLSVLRKVKNEHCIAFGYLAANTQE